MSTCKCGKKFVDEHGHGLCFGCKIQGVKFGSVDTGPSKMFRERQETQQILANGNEPIRRSEIDQTDKRDLKDKTPDLGDKIKKQIHAQFHA